MFLCVLVLCTFYYDVVTAVCQLLINEYVMLCYVTRAVSEHFRDEVHYKALYNRRYFTFLLSCYTWLRFAERDARKTDSKQEDACKRATH